MIRLQIDHKAYAEQLLFEQFELNLAAGELLCLLGPSGCGKTTLLNTIGGLDLDFQGRLEWGAVCRPDSVSYMFQQPRLLPWRTVRQNLALVIAPDQYDRIEPLLASMGLADCIDAYPNQLSLGMARRVALARSLIVDPELILMDEPFVSLDPPTAAEMRQQVQQLRRLRPLTSILFVTHDIREAISLADRILVLGGQPTQIQHQWQCLVPQSQRDSDYLAEQESLLLPYYRSDSAETQGCDNVRAGVDLIDNVSRPHSRVC